MKGGREIFNDDDDVDFFRDNNKNYNLTNRIGNSDRGDFDLLV